MSDNDPTPEEQNVAYQAWRQGETVQVRSWGNPWTDLSPTSTIVRGYILRRKPQPKLRKWNPEEVPVGAIVRQKANPNNRVVITAYLEGRGIHAGIVAISSSDWATDWHMDKTEYSVDMGKTWLPVGVVE